MNFTMEFLTILVSILLLVSLVIFLTNKLLEGNLNYYSYTDTIVCILMLICSLFLQYDTKYQGEGIVTYIVTILLWVKIMFINR